MYQFLVVQLGRPQKRLIGIGGNDFTRYQAILAKAVDCLEEFAFKEQVSVFNKLTVDLPGIERSETLQHGFWPTGVAWRCCQTCEQDLGRLRITDCELAGALNIRTCVMPWAADKAEVILPAHRRDHVLGRQIEGSIVVPCANENQWGDHEATAPDGLCRIEFNNISDALRGTQGHTSTLNNPISNYRLGPVWRISNCRDFRPILRTSAEKLF